MIKSAWSLLILLTPIFNVSIEGAWASPEEGFHVVKKKILVMTDRGGGGHMSASRAVENVLRQNYELRVIEPIQLIPFVGSYNKNQTKGNIHFLQMLTGLQKAAEFLADHFAVRKFIQSEILDFKPDLIISVIPVVNFITYDILQHQQLNTPFLILTTDLQADHFVYKFKQPGSSVKISLPFDEENLKAPLRKYLSDENFISLGFPLRPDFGISNEDLEPNIQAIKEELGIRQADKTVLIMMGAQGVGKTITTYASRIAKSVLGSQNEKIHVIALCGGNEALKRNTEAVSNPENPNVIIHALGKKSGDYVAAAMRMANVMISKPGGASVNEALASNLYTLYHTDRGILPEAKFDVLLPWEASNMEYTIERHWGERIGNKKQFLRQLRTALDIPRIQIQSCPGRQFGQNLTDYVDHLIGN